MSSKVVDETTDMGGNEGSREALPLAMLFESSCASAYHLADHLA